MNNPVISVIVPIYNSAPYLRKCLDSVAAQTHSALEILLVDDGSCDSSAEICREYTRRDSRFRLLQLEQNSGLSAARNRALEIASGEWIGFVDSDDYIEPDQFEFLLQQARESGADISICGWLEHSEDRATPGGWQGQPILSRDQALEALLQDSSMPSFVWNKLWKRAVIGDLRFPEGHIYEDVDFAWRAFRKAERIAARPEPKYHYVRRNNSLSSEWSVPKLLDFWRMALRRHDALAPLYPQHRELLEHDCVRLCGLILLLSVRMSFRERISYRDPFTQMCRFALSHREHRSYPASRLERILIRLYSRGSALGFCAAEPLIFLYRRKHRGSL